MDGIIYALRLFFHMMIFVLFFFLFFFFVCFVFHLSLLLILILYWKALNVYFCICFQDVLTITAVVPRGLREESVAKIQTT